MSEYHRAGEVHDIGWLSPTVPLDLGPRVTGSGDSVTFSGGSMSMTFAAMPAWVSHLCVLCKPDEVALNGPLEPCESCGSPVRWVTADDLRAGGAFTDCDLAEWRPGFVEASVHADRPPPGASHAQVWTHHTPERCRAAQPDDGRPPLAELLADPDPTEEPY